MASLEAPTAKTHTLTDPPPPPPSSPPSSPPSPPPSSHTAVPNALIKSSSCNVNENPVYLYNMVVSFLLVICIITGGFQNPFNQNQIM